MSYYETALATIPGRDAHYRRMSDIDRTLCEWELAFRRGRWTEARRLWAVVARMMKNEK